MQQILFGRSNDEEKEMDETSEDEKKYKIPVGKSEANRPLGRGRCGKTLTQTLQTVSF
jgi:hypothetical protein